MENLISLYSTYDHYDTLANWTGWIFVISLFGLIILGACLHEFDHMGIPFGICCIVAGVSLVGWIYSCVMSVGLSLDNNRNEIVYDTVNYMINNLEDADISNVTVLEDKDIFDIVQIDYIKNNEAASMTVRLSHELTNFEPGKNDTWNITFEGDYAFDKNSSNTAFYCSRINIYSPAADERDNIVLSSNDVANED